MFICFLGRTDEKNSNASVRTEALHYFGKDMEFNNPISFADFRPKSWLLADY